MALVFAISTIQAQQDGPIEYQENGDGPVLTLSSADPEGAGIDWDVTGIDADDFEISSGGVLTFKKSPDFENPTSRPHAAIDVNGNGATDGDDDRGEAEQAADADSDNFYQITIRATETSGYEGRALSTETLVTVEVTDQNEPGKVTLNWIQPEVATEITATLSDPDGMVGDPDGTATEARWQWYVSKVTNPVIDQEGHWVEATGAGDETAAYTPAGDRVDKDPAFDTDPDAAVDEDKMLRVVATYEDRFGATRTARAVSDNPVRAEVSSDLDEVENPENGSPGFTAGLDYTRTIAESAASGTNVGAPVVAEDPNNDTLTYELDNDLDPETTLDAPDADTAVGGADGGRPGTLYHSSPLTGPPARSRWRRTLDYDAEDDGEYTIFVRAIDPSGETAHVEVTVTATDANDTPMIMGSSTIDADGVPAK